jgi:hypothetical protein
MSVRDGYVSVIVYCDCCSSGLKSINPAPHEPSWTRLAEMLLKDISFPFRTWSMHHEENDDDDKKHEHRAHSDVHG